jgi:integrase
MSRGRGPYFQLVRAYRNEQGQPRQEVLVHLGTHRTPDDALTEWPSEIAHLRAIGRDEQADKLEANLRELREVMERRIERGRGMARKKSRGNGDGDVFPRKNKDGKIIGYRGTYWVQTADGTKRRYVSGKTKAECRAALTKARADRDGGLVYDAGALKVEDYLRRWLSDSVKDTVRATTFERYEQNCRMHIIPMLGRIKLKELTPAHVRGLYKEKLQDLSPRSVRYVHATLHKALRQAVHDGLILRNVTEAVKPPQIHREEINPLTPEQAKTLLETVRAEDDRLEALYVMAITTGLRQGELLGLKWDDVDPEAGTLQVRRTLTTAKGGPVLSAPKTKGSRRSVKLSQTARGALRSHLERQLGEMTGRALYGRKMGSSSPLRLVSLLIDATSPRTASSPWSSGRGCPRSAFTILGTRAQHCCWLRTSTPKLSRRCWGMPA